MIRALFMALAIAALLAVVLLPAALVLVGLIAFDIARGVWRTGPLVRRVIAEATRVAV